MPDQTVVAGGGLRVTLTGSDPDGDRLSFAVSGLPDEARVVSTSPQAALLYWNPTAEDTGPGGRRYQVRASADDGNGGTARIEFGVTVVPAAGIPVFNLPGGHVLNLAKDNGLTLYVTVKDDDSTDVELTLIEAPPGAKLQPSGPKSAHFYWRPDETEAAIPVHRAVFGATDETHPTVSHTLVIVLLHGEKDAGCEGTPPSILHTPAADQTLTGSSLEVQATVTDPESAVTGVDITWTTDPLAPNPPTTPLGESDKVAGSWSATLELPAIPPGGSLVHYHLAARDNDDATGSSCDLESRAPKSGYFTVAVYPPGAPPDACVDDYAEPDDQLGEAPVIQAGSYPGRRLCGAEADLARVGVTGGSTVFAEVSHAPEHGSLRLRLVDVSGGTLVEDASDDSPLKVQRFFAGDGVCYVEVSSSDPAARLSYTLSVAAETVVCSDDGLEPNDAPDQANQLGEGTHDELRLCPGEDDWYRVALDADSQLRITAAFDHAYGDLDLELRSADGLTLLGSSAGENSFEELTWATDVAQTVLLRVYGHQGAGNDYTLIVKTEALAEVCDDDLLSPNHSPPMAVSLFQGIYDSLMACPGKTDWYAVDLNGGETLDVLAEPADATQLIEVAIHDDPTTAPVVSSTSTPEDVAWASHALGELPGRLYYRVTGPATPANYAIYQEVTDPSGPCQPDRFEPNDDKVQAVSLLPGVYTWLRLCGDERDAFLVELPPFATLTVLTSHAVGQGFTDVSVVAADGSALGEALDVGSGVELSVLAEAQGHYLVYVDGYDVTSLGYDLAFFVD